MQPPLIKAIQRRVAVVAIGPSTARGQGVNGVVGAAQEYLASLPLKPFGTRDTKRFQRALDRATLELKAEFPDGARTWGLARKCLNIFIRDAFYNHYLRDHFELEDGECLHEIPLDRVVAVELHREMPRTLPRWPGVRHVNSEMSCEYQTVAAIVAQRFGISRVHLDTYLWVRGRKSSMQHS